VPLCPPQIPHGLTRVSCLNVTLVKDRHLIHCCSSEVIVPRETVPSSSYTSCSLWICEVAAFRVDVTTFMLQRATMNGGMRSGYSFVTFLSTPGLTSFTVYSTESLYVSC
jgi:hypothetical protein